LKTKSCKLSERRHKLQEEKSVEWGKMYTGMKKVG